MKSHLLALRAAFRFLAALLALTIAFLNLIPAVFCKNASTELTTAM